MTKLINQLTKQLIVACVLGAIASNAVAAGNNTTPEEKRGAIIGGLVGAGLGGPIGAGAGVIIGGGWMGKLFGLHRENRELNAKVAGLAQSQARDQDRYKRRIESLTEALARAEKREAVVDAVPIQFRTASAKLEGHYAEALEELASALAKRGDARVLLSGFADRRGDAAYNQKLSEDRVAEVRRFLLAHGVRSTQIATRAFGESRPVSETESPEDYFFDRRVVMELVNNNRSDGVAVR